MNIEDILQCEANPEELLNNQINLLSALQQKVISKFTSSVGGRRIDIEPTYDDLENVSKLVDDISKLSREARQWKKQNKDNLKSLSIEDKIKAIGNFLSKQPKRVQLEILTVYLTKIGNEDE